LNMKVCMEIKKQFKKIIVEINKTKATRINR